MKRICKFKEKWRATQEEIVEYVMKRKDKEDDRKKRDDGLEERYKKSDYLLIIGLLYFLLGESFFVAIRCNTAILDKYAAGVVVGVELLALGTYSILYSLIFRSEYRNWKKKGIQWWVKKLLIILMCPFYFCSSLWNGFLKKKKQEHVVQLLPYYLLSFLVVTITFAIIYTVFLSIDELPLYADFLTFMTSLLLICELFGLGYFFAFCGTWSVVKSIQKGKVKKTSKKKWRETMKSDLHKQERKNNFKKEWGIVKEELQYTKIYFYVLFNILILCMPKENNEWLKLLFNQFIGITSIAALLREVKSKTEEG